MSEVRESFRALSDDIMLLKPFLSARWLTSACATEPHHYTLTLSTYWQTQTHCLSLGMFQHTIGVFVHRHAFLSHPLYFPWMSTKRHSLLDTALGLLEPIMVFTLDCTALLTACFLCFCRIISPSLCLSPDRCNEISVYQTVLTAACHPIERALL